ncbi:hypothetical protein F9C07_2104639 [Aspergillus flavus]|uniref:SNF2 N-terminal domain-containing protein n=1 Tax=Aspergillus flavus (strain ATCC 200026 / FGSC A1120 / IAM 13836 / NRRL 3357 / JCM 12722 / SRRC 167) TaxID=332952 RepID=A0A7U2QUW7_ASPFN|nr:hypothetical protein F9C07_2104639 [Aspergillus flavus]
MRDITRAIAATKKGLATQDMSQFYLPFQYDNRTKERVSGVPSKPGYCASKKRLQDYQKVKSPNVFFSLPQHCTEFSRKDHDVACSMLGIENSDLCRIKGMRRSASLKFWQPALVWAWEFNRRLQSCILVDSVGLGKTWEAVV